MPIYLLIPLTLIALLLLWVNLQPLKAMNLMMLLGRKASKLSLKTASVKGVDWPYLEGGPAEAEVVVFVHGFAANKDTWPIYTKHFYKKYRVVVPDLPGFGDNIKDLGRDYGITAQTDDLADFLRTIGVEKCHIVGNSMGGHVSLNFAVKYPELLHSLTLINNAGIRLDHKSDIELAVDAGENPLEMKSADDVTRQIALVMHKPVYLPGFFKRAMYHQAQLDKVILDKIFWATVAESEAMALNDSLSQISVPTLILWGRHDRIIDVSTAAILNEGIKNSQCVIIEEAGHVPMAEKPAITAQHNIEFLDSLSLRH